MIIKETKTDLNSRNSPGIIIAGTHSGVGKTSIAIGVMRALKNRGLNVQPFKIGPDFIDPTHHRRATGRVSHNLDGWMLSGVTNSQIFNQNCRNSDIGIIEGVMGLFDGYGSSEAGSTAQIAKWLGIPVILVIDVKAIARSAAAIIHGYNTFDPELTIAGIICNRIASSNHLDIIRQSLEGIVSPPILGGIPRDSTVEIKRRHLGLLMSEEDNLDENYIERLATLIETNINLDQIINLAHSKSINHQNKSKSSLTNYSLPITLSPVKIGIARDEAFCFYYPENLDLLRKFGAELVEFSPLRDSLPEGLNGIYFGGGYPELYAEELASNSELLTNLKKFCVIGYPVYGECGGLIYLSSGLKTNQRQSYPLVGIFPFWTGLSSKLKLGYTEIQVKNSNSLFPEKAIARGHCFHYSEIIGNLKIPTSYIASSRRRNQFFEGYQVGNTLASYIHLHFASNPDFPKSFVQKCRSKKKFHPGKDG